MILGAGFGTRLRPLTDRVPKPLLPVGDRPAYGHVARVLREMGLGPIVMNAHHLADAFNTVEPGVTVVRESRILGTAGGVRNAAPALGPGEVLVWNGDIFAHPDLPRLLAMHRQGGNAVTLLCAARPDPEGTVGVGAQDQVVRLRNEHFGQQARSGDFMGIQVLSPAAREMLPQEGCLIGDLVMPLLRQGERVGVVWHEGPWRDIGSPAALLQANLEWLSHQHKRYFVASHAQVQASADLDQAVVCEGAYVTGTGLLRRCLVLPGASVCAPASDCIVMDDGTKLRVSVG